MLTCVTRMTKVVIDTNIFISSFFGGIPKQIIDFWKSGEVTLCLSQAIVEEYIKVLNRLKLEQQEIQQLTLLFAEGYHSIYTSQTPSLNIVKADPDDNKFIECAVALDCKIIISGDKHLKDIKKYIDIQILSPRDFLDNHGSNNKPD